MRPWITGARPGKTNMMSRPNSASSRLLPERKPSPTPTKRSRDPTPQAMPNMVRKERSLCAQRLRKIWAKMSDTDRIIETLYILRGLEQGPLAVRCAEFGHGCSRIPGSRVAGQDAVSLTEAGEGRLFRRGCSK